MLLLELPQLGVDVERAAKVRLPLPVPILGQIAEPVEQLLRLFEQVAKFQHYFPILFLR